MPEGRPNVARRTCRKPTRVFLGDVFLGEALPGTNLAEFLSQAGHPLNTRCNQQGLCRGCEVELLPDGQVIKACQCLFECKRGVPHRDSSSIGFGASARRGE